LRTSRRLWGSGWGSGLGSGWGGGLGGGLGSGWGSGWGGHVKMLVVGWEIDNIAKFIFYIPPAS